MPNTTAKRRAARGSGTIYRHTSGLWCWSVSLGRDADGKRVRLAMYARTRPELLRRVADERARVGGSFKPRVEGTVGDWFAQWLAEEVQPNKSAATYASYAAVWGGHVKPLLGHVTMHALGVDHVLHMMRRMRADGTSASMVARCIRVMHRAIEVAIRQGRYHGKNPFGMVDKPKAETREARFLSTEECRRFIAAARADRFEALWVINLLCGLRLGESMALRWADIDEKAHVIRVRRSYSVAGKDFKEPKSRASRRAVDYGAIVAEALGRRRAAHAAEGHGSDLVFCTRDGKAMQQSNLRRKHFAPILKRAGIEGVRIHDLRHSATAIGLAAGISPKVMQDRLGHAQIATTMNVYGHSMPGMGQAAAAAIDAQFRPQGAT